MTAHRPCLAAISIVAKLEQFPATKKLPSLPRLFSSTPSMARFALLALATAATLVSGYTFKKPCVQDKDICGWALQADYGGDPPFSSPLLTPSPFACCS
jgi:hypothetical protein